MSWTDGGDGYQYRDTSTLDGWTIVEIRDKSTGDRFYSAYRDGDQFNPMGWYDNKDQIERAIRGY